jgi:hypothetical protein
MLAPIKSELTTIRSKFNVTRHQKVKSIEDYKQELLIQLGREQFKKLADKGLSLPIAVL